jgi:hypothetical protein
MNAKHEILTPWSADQVGERLDELDDSLVTITPILARFKPHHIHLKGSDIFFVTSMNWTKRYMEMDFIVQNQRNHSHQFYINTTRVVGSSDIYQVFINPSSLIFGLETGSNGQELINAFLEARLWPNLLNSAKIHK